MHLAGLGRDETDFGTERGLCKTVLTHTKMLKEKKMRPGCGLASLDGKVDRTLVLSVLFAKVWCLQMHSFTFLAVQVKAFWWL